MKLFAGNYEEGFGMKRHTQRWSTVEGGGKLPENGVVLPEKVVPAPSQRRKVVPPPSSSVAKEPPAVATQRDEKPMAEPVEDEATNEKHEKHGV